MGGLIGSIAVAALAAALLWTYKADRLRRQQEPIRFFGTSLTVLDDVRFEPNPAAGYPKAIGRYKDFTVQVQPVVDTLALRRLPALWLLVTLHDALPLESTFDMMMRPSGTLSFSNFDRLAVTIGRPDGFPEQAVVRTDSMSKMLPPTVVQPHLAPFHSSKAKELLITPNGLRFVWLLAEGDRARYGVFREAAFNDPVLDAELLRDLLDRLEALRTSIIGWSNQQT